MTTERQAHGLIAHARRFLDRDRELPGAHKVKKALRFASSRTLAPLYLLGCDRVGPGARALGRPVIHNAGRIEIGARASLGSLFAPAVLSTGPEGRIVIGDDLIFNYGATISAKSLVEVGARVSFGPYVMVDDDDGAAGDERGPMPIHIGDDVWIAARARVKKGVTIGRGAVIAAGSEVRGDIPAGVLAGGVPARVLRTLDGVAGAAKPTPPVHDGAHGSAAWTMLHDMSQQATEALARLVMRHADTLGARPRIHGSPYIENLGSITIGDDFELGPGPVPAHFVTGPRGAIRIGDGVTIGAGTGIAAEAEVTIGDGAHIGPLVSILTTDYHVAGNYDASGGASPIRIGAGAWIGERVIILRGVTIGHHARIEPGSVVTTDIPDGACAAGVRARVIAAAS
ncbi:MAG: acyltransferase [Byssovorax sp.]